MITEAMRKLMDYFRPKTPAAMAPTPSTPAKKRVRSATPKPAAKKVAAKKVAKKVSKK